MSPAERHLPDGRIMRAERTGASRHRPEQAAQPGPAPIEADAELVELRRAKAAAEAANEAKSRYLVAVSHEIRSPLNAIYGYAQLLERGDAVTGAEAGAAIRRSVDHLTNLAESLLELSRVESGVLTVQSDVIDIRALLEQTVSMFRAQAIAKGLSLGLQVGARLPALVKTDQKRLRQVLINLVSNAIKYTEAGRVDIVVDRRNEVATIDVIDTGIGIEPTDIERIFQPFERGGSSIVQSQPGIGLGLAITRVLAQVLGGDITATSTVGAGSRFRLKLMLSSAVPASEKAIPALVAGYEGRRRTVLLIEDDPEQRAGLQSLLSSLDFAVYSAATGEEGIALADRCSPDIVLLDVEMPGIGGWETARQLRATWGSDLKIVMVSATAADTAMHDPDRRACDAMLAKPVAFDCLFATMQTLGLHWRETLLMNVAADPSGITSPAPEMRPFLERLRHAALTGHVLEFTKQLSALEQAVPSAMLFAGLLRKDLQEFDFASIIDKIENARAR